MQKAMTPKKEVMLKKAVRLKKMKKAVRQNIKMAVRP